MNDMIWIQIGWLAVGVFLGVTVFKRVIPFAGRLTLKVRFWLRHGSKGKRILFVYSDSSIWKDYIEANILPRIESHAIILNCSKRREWGSRMQLEAKLFAQWAGTGQFVPVAILFSSISKARIFRLWKSGDGSKHGKPKIVKETEQALFETVKRLPLQGVEKS